MNPLPFFFGYPAETSGVLTRYFAPVRAGMASAILDRFTQPGDLILDLFAQSPAMVVEAAQAGRRVAVVSRNPIIRFAHTLACDPPDEATARRALTRLADAHAGGATVEQVVRGLYESTCPDCGRAVEPEYLAWRENAPFEMRYICPHCGEDKLRPTTPADVELARRHAGTGPGHYWALDQIAPPGDAVRGAAELALHAYTPRALHALFTLTTKAQSLALPADERRALDALLLHVYDEANSLWPYPSERGRPRTLRPHRQFRERNIWLALEQAVAAFRSGPPLRRVALAELLADRAPGVALIDLPRGELAAALATDPIALALSAIPRPNPALWALSVLWSGWLWDDPLSPEFKQLLRRRRYEWAWHESALRQSLPVLARLPARDGRFVGLLPHLEAALLTSTLTAAAGAGLLLESLALEATTKEAQASWVVGAQKNAARAAERRQLVRKQTDTLRAGARAVLAARAEPAPHLIVRAGALWSLARQSILGAFSDSDDPDPYSVLAAALDALLANATALQRIASGRRGDSVRYWPQAGDRAAGGVSARAEAALAQFLAGQPGADAAAVFQAVFDALPGLLTPELSWLEQCLRSYGEADEAGNWRLREEDRPQRRARDVAEMRDLLRQLGSQLALEPAVADDGSVRWLDHGDELFNFVIQTSGSLQSVLAAASPPAAQRCVVVPASRAGMIRFQMQRDPHLQAVVAGGWRILKFRHIRRLAARSDLTPGSFHAALELDPLDAAAGAQMPLF